MKKAMMVSVEFHFLAERGSHRLKASLSSDENLNFPPELLEGTALQSISRRLRTLRELRVCL